MNLQKKVFCIEIKYLTKKVNLNYLYTQSKIKIMKTEENDLDFYYDEYYFNPPPLVPIFIVAVAIGICFYFLFT